jgi:hypothetical protein
MDVTLETAAERGRKAGYETVLVVGWVHPRNEASKRPGKWGKTSWREPGIIIVCSYTCDDGYFYTQSFDKPTEARRMTGIHQYGRPTRRIAPTLRRTR